MKKTVAFANSANAPNKQQYGHGMSLSDEESSVDQRQTQKCILTTLSIAMITQRW
jgi:hypothetical protein